MEETFNRKYKTKGWGDNKDPDYKGSSGEGSKLSYNIDTYVPFLKHFINTYNIKTIVDLGCGDFVCGRAIYDGLDVNYIGYDTYGDVIKSNSHNFSKPKFTFVHLDFYSYKERLVGGDLCIIKDVLQHWSLDTIYTFLDYITTRRMYKYILIVNCGYQQMHDTDISTGEFRALNHSFFPLRKYNPIKLFTYKTKEVSLIVTPGM